IYGLEHVFVRQLPVAELTYSPGSGWLEGEERETTPPGGKKEGLVNAAIPQASKLGWSDLDIRAVKTAKALAADAVEHKGNGHPGAAISLAPAAYLLYQNIMRHDPATPDWLGRDRFV